MAKIMDPTIRKQLKVEVVADHGDHVGQRMVGGFLRVRIVLAGIGEMSAARARERIGFSSLGRGAGRSSSPIQNCGDRRVGECFGGEELHAALRDTPGFSQAVG